MTGSKRWYLVERISLRIWGINIVSLTLYYVAQSYKQWRLSYLRTMLFGVYCNLRVLLLRFLRFGSMLSSTFCYGKSGSQHQETDMYTWFWLSVFETPC